MNTVDDYCMKSCICPENLTLSLNIPIGTHFHLTMSLSSIAHRMNVDFASTLALTTKPFDGASANDAPAAAYEHHVLPTNATRQAVALVDTAKGTL